MRRVCQYLVTRIRNIYGYAEHFGPVVSRPGDIRRDAQRLYGKDGYTLKWKAWSKATRVEQEAALKSA